MIRSFVCLVAMFVLAGCISASVSPTPRFYKLRAADNSAVSQRYNMPSDVIIEVGPVNIPLYLDRPQIVTQDKNQMLNFAQFDRWGEPLDSALERLAVENLTLMLPGASIQMFPCNFAIPLIYQVAINIVQLDCVLDGELLLVAQWTIIDAQEKKMLLTRRSEFRQPIEPHSYAGLARALEQAYFSLSSQIAEAVPSARL